MPLLFSPLSEAVLDSPPKNLLPKHAFTMRQLGDPPDLDVHMSEAVTEVFKSKGIKTIDADGGPDRASMKFGYDNGFEDKLVSLGGLLSDIRYRPMHPIREHYEQKWLDGVRTKLVLGIL
ncbi:MAG: hypothetical protein EON58_22615 [Alphaproteobacteria bacterium]|nr:MAG: hypothetical protein EON58_22615 [Alphaproteobacteria bacterium]